MTPERLQQWADYIVYLQDSVGLKDWVLRLTDTPPDIEDAAAMCEDTFGRKVAVISLATDWNNLEPEKQRHCVVHELIHPHFAQVWTWTNRRFHGLASEREFAVIDDTYTQLMEYGIDAMAAVIAPHLPLPAEVVPELGPQQERAKGKKGKKK